MGEAVRLLDGGTATVVALHALPGVGPMWDLSLDAVHTFAVGDVRVVVHNCGSSTYEEQVRIQNGDYTGAEHQGLAGTHPDAIRGEGTPNETYIDAKEFPAGATNRQVFELSRDTPRPSDGELYQTTRGNQLMRYAALYQDTGTPFEYWFQNAPAQEVIDTIQRFGGGAVIWPQGSSGPHDQMNNWKEIAALEHLRRLRSLPSQHAIGPQHQRTRIEIGELSRHS